MRINCSLRVASKFQATHVPRCYVHFKLLRFACMRILTDACWMQNSHIAVNFSKYARYQPWHFPFKNLQFVKILWMPLNPHFAQVTVANIKHTGKVRKDDLMRIRVTEMANQFRTCMCLCVFDLCYL